MGANRGGRQGIFPPADSFARANRLRLSELKNENRLLRAEIKRLNRVISSADVDGEDSDHISEPERLWREKEKESGYLAHSSFIKYAISKITGGSLYALYKKALTYFRKFKLVSTVMRVISSIFAILGTGAFFIFLSGALIFIIPTVLLFCMGIYVINLLARAKAFKRIKEAVAGREIIVFFLPRERDHARLSYFAKAVDAVSNGAEANRFIIIVSPYFWISDELSDKRAGFYPVARFDKENACFLRQHSFFLLRKRILESNDDKTVYIY